MTLAGTPRGRTALGVFFAIFLSPVASGADELVRRAEERLRASVQAGRLICAAGESALPLTSLRLVLAAPEQPPAAVQMAAEFLEVLARSELHDHLGGGFLEPRCAEGAWRPTFEKNAETNAQLLAVFARGYVATRRLLFREVVDHGIAFLIREMRGGSGLFFSGLSASPDVGARHYLWTEQEVQRFLGADQSREFLETYRLKDGWLSLIGDPFAGIAASRQVLLARRGRRVKLEIDTRADAIGNSLVIAALGRAGEVLGRGAATEAARRAARQAGVEGLDRKATAHMAWALLQLNRATSEQEWRDRAKDLVDHAVRQNCRIVPDRRAERLDCRWDDQAEPGGEHGTALLSALLRLSDESGGRYGRLATRLETSLRAAAPPGSSAEERLQLALGEGGR